jgi:hypothetical protein
MRAVARAGASAVLSWLLLTAALPAVAGAKPGYRVEPRGVSLTMSARATDGYRLTVRTFGHHLVLLTASKGSVSAEYTVRGTVSRTGVRANFGPLGRIAVRFHGAPKPPRSHSPVHFECSGKRPIHEVGAFTGTVRFHGEQGFTEFSGHRIRGTVLRRFRRVCSKEPSFTGSFFERRAGSGSGSPPEVTVFTAASQVEGRSVQLLTVGTWLDPSDRGERAWFGFGEAYLRESRGRVVVNRSANLQTDPGSVLEGPPGQQAVTATVTLPKPFGGTATYSKARGAEALWTGTLHVWLPGAGAVPLTGEGFEAVYCHTHSKRRLRRCLGAVRGSDGISIVVVSRAATPRVQLSGSHSQALGDARLSWSR